MMHNKIIIYLYATHSAYASWAILSESGHITQSVTQGDLHSLSLAAKHSDVYVIVPAQDVLLISATLPKLSSQRMKQALPYALEEHLIDDVNELHFAIAGYQADGTLPVAVVAQQKMLAWVDLFKELDITPRAFIPATLALPYVEHAWRINSYEQSSIVRTGKYSGFACETDNLETLLELRLAEEQAPADIRRTQWSEQDIIEKTAYHLTQLPYINLLQGAYQTKQHVRQVKKTWLMAGYLLVACIALALFGNIISLLILRHEVHKIDSAVDTIYRRQFPNATSVVAPRERMTEKLKKLSGAANKNPFLTLLAIISKHLPANKSVRLQNVDFREQLLTAEVSAASFDSLDTFTHALTKQGLNVKQQNAAIFGTQVKATLLIRMGSA